MHNLTNRKNAPTRSRAQALAARPESATQAPFGLEMLRGLGSRVNVRGAAMHVYGGTVPEREVARRRAANKVARRSRRANRR